MRVSGKTFGERKKIKKEIKHKYFLIYEGAKTEVRYFGGLIENREQLKINPIIEMIPLFRSYNEEHWSNPKKILEKIISYFENSSDGTIIVSDFVNYVIDWLLEESIITNTSIYNERNIRNISLKYFCEKSFCEKDKIDVKIACKLIAKCFLEKINIADAITSIDNYMESQLNLYDSDYDKICLIVDRDKQSFKEKQYDDVNRTCKEKGYLLFVSNPCFEFWLLLHFDVVLSLDKEKLLKNPKETSRSKKRFLEKKLSELMNGYSKNNLRFDILKDRIEKAIDNEREFCESISELKTNLGCNIGELIKEIKIT